MTAVGLAAALELGIRGVTAALYAPSVRAVSADKGQETVEAKIGFTPVGMFLLGQDLLVTPRTE